MHHVPRGRKNVYGLVSYTCRYLLRILLQMLNVIKSIQIAIPITISKHLVQALNFFDNTHICFDLSLLTSSVP